MNPKKPPSAESHRASESSSPDEQEEQAVSNGQDSSSVESAGDRVDAKEPLSAEVDAPDAMDQLKRLLVGDERNALEALNRRIDEEQLGPAELSEMLPLAVRKAAQRDDQFAAALGPTLANSFQDSVKRNPKALADAISPIMGPAIRRAISQAISTMIQSLNQTVEHSFSWNGMKWRWQAFKTGKPFAEVVLLNAFVYRVEQIFLIHREDGALLAHADASGTSGVDADLVSGMLTAIQDFVRQSFGASEDDAIESMRVGDHHVWILPSPHALMAVVIRGVPPMDLRKSLRGELESIHEEMSVHLNEYAGDNTPFEMIVPRLEKCLQSEARRPDQPKSSVMKTVVPVCLLLFPLLVATFLGGWGIHWLRKTRRAERVVAALRVPPTAEATYEDGVVTISGEARHEWIDRTQKHPGVIRHLKAIELDDLVDLDAHWFGYVDRLRKEPGIVVVETSVEGDRYRIQGLRDPAAIDPVEALTEAGVSPSSVDARWEPYQSMEPRFVERRLLGQAPSSEEVLWQMKAGRLVANGRAPHLWFRSATQFAASTSGVAIDFSAVENETAAELAAIVKTVDQTTLAFSGDSAQLGSDELVRIKQLAAQIGRLQSLAASMDEPLDIMVVAYVVVGADNSSLARRRAVHVWKSLTQHGASKQGLFVRSERIADSEDKDGMLAHHCVIRVEPRASR